MGLINAFKFLVMGRHGDNSEVRFFRSFFAMNIIAVADILLHVLYFILFVVFGYGALLLSLQALAIIAGICALVANHRGTKDTAAIILTVEVGVYSVVWLVFMGGASYMQWFALCGMIAHYLFTDISKKKRTILMVFLAVCINASLLIDRALPPLVPNVNYAVFSTITFNAIFLTMILELLLSSIATGIAQRHFDETLAHEKDISMKDPLTGLWNRRYIHVQENPILSMSLNTSNCLAILDIDHFKLVNDSYGHAVGDRMLQHFANLMMTSFRSTDVIIRWGGEEFMLMISGVGIERAGEMLTGFLKKTRASPLQTEDGRVAFTFTAGVCELHPDMPLQAAVETADRRLYAGKNAGRNRIVIRDE